MPDIRRVFSWTAALLVLAAPLAGQAPPAPPFVPGAVAEGVTSLQDSAQRYAVFLPSTFDSTRAWPLLCVMDPRGRALLPLGLLRRGAERFGYIIVSSYNTRSDEPGDPNVAAVNAMIADAQRRWPIDARRIYLVGFSGTTRAGWDYAYRLEGHVAGLIGFGAGFPPGWAPPAPAAGELQLLAFYGGAGTSDFNYQEVQDLDAYLDGIRLRHHVASYPGPHGWAPEPVMFDALLWMELQAMRRGLIERKMAWVDSIYRARESVAASLDSAGDRPGAALAYRALAADFAALRDVSTDSARLAALLRDRAVIRAGERRAALAAHYHQYIERLRRFIAKVRQADAAPSLPAARKELQLQRLARQAADSGDRPAALEATQLLEQVFVVTAFYEPREALAAGHPARALALLEIAESIHAGTSLVCERRREALADLGRAREAAALPCQAE